MLIVALLPALTPILLALVPLFNALAEVIAALVPILIPIIDLVAKLATILANYLAKYINSVLVPAIKAIAALLRGDFSGAFGYAKQAAGAMVKWLLSLFTKLPGQVWTAAKPLASKLWSVASEAGGKLITASKNGVNSALGWLKALPGRAVSGLGDLGGVLKRAGESLIRGFINGIKSQFGDVKSTLGGLTSKLTSWKGPAPLDRKILTPAGRMVIGGFQEGIKRQTPLLRKQLQGLTGDLPGMAADISPRGVFSASMRNAQSITFDVTGADEDMKRLIRRIVKNDGRGNVQTAFGR
jgi:phage-related protein